MIVLNNKGRFEFTIGDIFINDNFLSKGLIYPKLTDIDATIIYGMGDYTRIPKYLYAGRFITSNPSDCGSLVRTERNLVSNSPFSKLNPGSNCASIFNSRFPVWFDYSSQDGVAYIYKYCARRGGWICIAKEQNSRNIYDIDLKHHIDLYGAGSMCTLLNPYCENI